MVFARHPSIDELRQFQGSPNRYLSATYDGAGLALLDRGTAMLRVHRKASGDVVFTLSGRIDKENIADLEALIAAEGTSRRITLDLKDMTLTGQDGITFLAQCEASGITLANCDPYVREWIARQGTES